MRAFATGVALVGALAATTVVTTSALAAPTPPPSTDDVFQPQIVGGDNATETYSFMVSLQDSYGGHFCGGSLIKSQWVVTAEHCVDNGVSQVRVGSTKSNSDGTVVKVASITKGAGGGGGDIALIKLAEAVTQTPVPIAAGGGAEGTATRLIGWGSTTGKHGDAPIDLKQIDVKVTSGCTSYQGWTYYPDRELCLGGVAGKSACYGDSGGPAFRAVNGTWELTGATSRAGQGKDLCQDNTAAIYTDVTKYKDWIAKVTGDGGTPTPKPCDGVEAWSANKLYFAGSVVSHKSHKWKATTFTWGKEPGVSGDWTDQGAC